MRTLDWAGDHIVAIDQTKLPGELVLVELRSVDDVIDAIRRLAVRGAPAIGVCGALGVALAARNAAAAGATDAEVRAAAARIRGARPTAVNLAWAVDRTLAVLRPGPAAAGVGAVTDAAVALLDEDVATNRALSARGADLVAQLLGDRPVRIHTHCNAGGLACIEWGTALGIVRALHERGRVAGVVADETRPLLQGARLTAFELDRMGVPYRVVVDGAAASIIARGLVDVVVVGADRIAADGDVANKVGTYALALAAARAGVPFLVAAPESTIDAATPTGDAIEIEERDPAEVLTLGGSSTAPAGADALNPAFDVTPGELVTAIVTESRVIRPAAGERP